ncbi:lamin-A-like [Boleophthalmus pectinirostris]|uniref:lamin-A-like n=1 Tax=Boleophthalmus pectinirostris TaxID=150288 RepID=UPI00243076F1|nr:lamin-A-like [Boleophthalmus pectinirostris]
MSNKNDILGKYEGQRPKLLKYFNAVDNPLKSVDDDSINEIENEKEALQILNKRLEEYIKEVASLEQKKKKLQQDLQKERNIISKVKEFEKEERKELEDKKTEYIKLILKYNELQVRYNEECIELERAKYQIKQYDKDIADANDKYKKLQQSISGLTKCTELSVNVIEEFSKTLQMTEKENKVFNERLETVKKAADKTKKDLGEKTKEWAALKREIASLEKTLIEMEEEHRTEITTFEQEIATYNLELSKTQIKKAMTLSSYTFFSKDKVKEEIETYSKLLESAAPKMKPSPTPQDPKSNTAKPAL